MKKLLILGTILLAGIGSAAAQCEIPLDIVPTQGGGFKVPEATQQMLMTRLTTAALASGEVSQNGNAPFFLTARFDHINKGVLPGPPMQHTVSTELTLMIGGEKEFGEASNKQIFATETLTLKGVGNSEEKALANALQRLNGKNQTLRSFIAEGRDKIIEYYDKNTPALLQRAEKASALGNYDEALSYVVMVPECSSGYASALSATKKYYSKYADFMGDRLVKEARNIWAANPTPEQISQLLALLENVPVGSSAEKEAEKLYKEMEASLKDDRHFETRQKYADALDLEKRSLEAAREVGTAYGKGPKANSNLILSR